MKPTSSFRHFLSAIGSSLIAISSAFAADGTWNVDANGLWSAAGNWTPGIADGSGFTANFTNNITADRTVSLDSDRTLTSLVFGDSDTSSAGSWILDNNGTATNNLILVGTTPGITVNALGTGKTATISAIIQGTVGLVKSGTGTLILSGANTYTGTTAINLGTLQVNSGGTLGNTANALTMGTGGDGTLGDASNLTLNTTATIGAFTVKSNTSDTTTLSNINQLIIASGSTLTASSFTVGFQNVAASTNVVNTALSTGATAGAGGTLNVTGASLIGLRGPDSTGANTTVVDLRGLHTFNSGALSVGSNRNSKATLYLANNANTINGNISVGDSGNGINYNIAGVSQLYLGAGTNALQAATITIGGGKGAGQILFAGSGGSVVITGAGGAGLSIINIGSHGTSSYQGSATNSLLLAGHTATVSAAAVTLGLITHNTAAAGSALNSLLTFDTGTFTADSVNMGVVNSGRSALTHAVNSTFTVGGDTANSAATGIVNISGNILLGNNDTTNANATGATSGTLTINGGTVNVNTGNLTTGGIFDGSISTVSSSLISTLTLEGGTLNLNGGRIGGTANTNSAGARDIDNLNFRSGTLMNVLSINETAGLTKTTSGTLNLSGTNSYTGGTSVTDGTLVFRSLAAKPTGGAHAFNAGTTLGLGVGSTGFFTDTDVTNAFAGTMTGNLSNVTVTATTNVGIDTTAGSFTYSTSIAGSPTRGLAKLGANTLTLEGANTYTGATLISGGSLQLGSGSTTGSLTATTAITNNANLTINRSNAFTQATDLGAGVAISGTGSFTQAGAGTTTLTAVNTSLGSVLAW